MPDFKHMGSLTEASGTTREFRVRHTCLSILLDKGSITHVKWQMKTVLNSKLLSLFLAELDPHSVTLSLGGSGQWNRGHFPPKSVCEET